MNIEEQKTCKQPPGVIRPMVNPAKCEAKGDCVEVCPFDVFQIERIDPEVYRSLPRFSKFKVFVHGMKTAITPNANACEGCGLCVSACPERAIQLVRTPR